MRTWVSPRTQTTPTFQPSSTNTRCLRQSRPTTTRCQNTGLRTDLRVIGQGRPAQQRQLKWTKWGWLERNTAICQCLQATPSRWPRFIWRKAIFTTVLRMETSHHGRSTREFTPQSWASWPQPIPLSLPHMWSRLEAASKRKPLPRRPR